MRVNRETVLVGTRVVLVPYRREHVPTYHEWMKDPQIQQQTASEPLSLEQEYDMQRSWALDEDKLTFIILARPESGSASELGSTPEELVQQSRMVGDVNIFFNEAADDDAEKPAAEDDDSDLEDAVVADSRPGSPLPVSTQLARRRYDAECEIMIAEQNFRRKGLAKEALQLLFHYVTARETPRVSERDEAESDLLPVPPSWLTCKISLDNAPSIALFERLGFAKGQVSEVWKEVEMRLQLHPCDKGANVGVCPLRVERWPLAG